MGMLFTKQYGSFTSDGAAKTIYSGCTPQKVRVYNPAKGRTLEWVKGMADGAGYIEGNVVNGALNTPTMSIGTTKTRVATALFNFAIAGLRYAKAAVAAGTAPHATTITANGAKPQFAAYGYEIAADGTLDAVSAATTTNKDSAALALAAYQLVAASASHIKLGCVIVECAAGAVDFIGATDNLDDAQVASLAYFYEDLATFTTSTGITPVEVDGSGEGFTIGADTQINVSGDTLYWEADCEV